MVQDFNEYINRLNRAANMSPAKNPVMDFINTHNRLQANPESVFGNNARYNPNVGFRPGDIIMKEADLWRPGGYNQMVTMQSPRPRVDYAQKNIDKLTEALTGVDLSDGNTAKKTVIKKIDTSPQVVKNVKDTGKAIKGVAKGAAKAAPKVAGKIAPVAGAGIAGYDIYRSLEIARLMEQENSRRPGTYPQGAIDYYKGKARALIAGTGVGAVGGGVLGAGAFSAPGALIGAGTGATVADLAYGFANRNNPYKEYRLNEEILNSLETANNSNGFAPTSQLDNSSPTNTNGYDLEIIDDMPLDNSQQELILPQQLRNRRIADPRLVQGSGIDSNIDMQSNNNSSDYPDNDIISEYVKRYNDLNKPYVDSLQNYYNNYEYMLDQARRANRFWQGAASLTGNPAWSKIADYYNPLTTEANRIALLKKLQEARSGNINDVYELIGNTAVAREMGLPDEASMANKNLLTALVNQRRYDMANLARMYGYDIGADTRRYVADRAYASNLAGRDISGRYGMQGQLLSGLAYSDPEVAKQIAIQYGMLPQDIQPAPGLDKRGLPQVNQGDPFKYQR